MNTVHVFISKDRFHSFDEMRRFVEETYTEDGDGIPSPFMREIGLSGYEPGCIECMHRPQPVTLAELLAGASYSEQWLPSVDRPRLADAAICVFVPNKVRHPHGSSLEYIGAFEYRVVHPEWLERLLLSLERNAE